MFLARAALVGWLGTTDERAVPSAQLAAFVPSNFSCITFFVFSRIALFLHPFFGDNNSCNRETNLGSKMTKADIVNRIAEETGMEKHDVQSTVEAFMRSVRDSLEGGENVYLRGFGSFVIKTRAAKTGRNILAKSPSRSRAQHPSFKPAKDFVENVKTQVKVD